MVILETALIGAGGYAAYRGGEKAVHVGARKMDDLKRQSRRNEDQRGFNAKARERSSRLSEIQERMAKAKSGSVATLTSNSTATASTTAAADNNGSTDQRLQKERFNSIKERYSEVRGKPATKKKGLFGRFKKGSK